VLGRVEVSDGLFRRRLSASEPDSRCGIMHALSIGVGAGRDGQGKRSEVR